MKKLSLFIVILSSIAFGQQDKAPLFDFLEEYKNKTEWIGPYKILSLSQIGGETSFEISDNGQSRTIYLFPTVIRSGDFGNTLEVQRAFDLLLCAFEKKKKVFIMEGICHVGGPKAEEYSTADCCFAVRISE